MTSPTSAMPGPHAAFRFLLELAALLCWGIVGWQATDGPARFVLVGALPLACAVMWGRFRVPGDESASGEAPVAVSGPVRLAIELALLLGAAIATAVVWRTGVGAALAALVAVHYATTPRRVRWLLARTSNA